MKKDLMSLGDYVISLLKSVITDTAPCNKPAEITWEEIYAFSKFHNVSGTVYCALEKLNISEDEKAPFYEDYKKYILREARQEMMTRHLLSEFEQAKIRCMPIKGYIIKRLYPLEAMRYSVDVDIYFDPTMKDELDRIMLSEGFEFKAEEYDQLIYYKKPIFNFEMHKSILESNETGNEYFLNVFDRSTLMPGYSYCYNMSENDVYICSILHFYKHYIGEGAGLRFILDLYLMKNGLKNADRAYIEKTLGDFGVLEFAKHMEALSEIWFSDKEYDERYRKIAAFLYANGVFGNGNTGSVNRATSDGKDSFSFFKRCRNYLKWYFLSNNEMKKIYPILNKAPFLLPFCWLHKGLKTAICKPKAIKKEFNKLKLASKLEEIYTLSGIKKTK